ncbi:MAG: SHOCT domain-containing protein [Dehalococcoidales bacterium]
MFLHDGMGWWMAFVFVFMVFFWGGLIALVVWGVKKLTGRNGSSSRQAPLDIAKERYAKGEISEEEFQRLKKDLAS